MHVREVSVDGSRLSTLAPIRTSSEQETVKNEQAEQTSSAMSSVAPLELMSMATSVIRSASWRAKQALVDLKDDIVNDIMISATPSQQQNAAQAQGWALPWGRTEEDRTKEEMRRRIQELSMEPFRFLVPLPAEEQRGDESSADADRETKAAALQVDSTLQVLRDELVPRMLSEAEFWRRYMTAVRSIKQSMFPKSNSSPSLPPCLEDPVSSEKGCDSPTHSASTSTPYNSPYASSWGLLSPVRMPSTGTSATASVSSNPSEGFRCPSSGHDELLRRTCSCSDSPHFEAPCVLRQDSEEVGRKEEVAEVEGPLSWLTRSFSGKRAVAVVREQGEEGRGSKGLPSPCVTPKGASSGRKSGFQNPLLLWSGQGMPPTQALHHLHTAFVSSGTYSTCAELAEADASSSSAWAAFGSFSMGSGVRRRLATSSPFVPSSPRLESSRAIPPLELGSSSQESLSHSAIVESLFKRDGVPSPHEAQDTEDGSPARSYTRSLHGAPPGSFVAELAVAMTRLTSAQEMAQLWLEVVNRLTWHFRRDTLIPGVPLEDDHPDLHMCEVMQHLQLINLCMMRRRRRNARLVKEASDEGEDYESRGGGSKRRGVKGMLDGVSLVETGESVFIPETQDAPLMTESTVRETEEQVMRTGTLGNGCTQLFSDMQAFKAANPGCVLEDFVRWYSPPDWSPTPFSLSGKHTPPPSPTREVSLERDFDTEEGTESLSRRGYLSTRMSAAGNMWQELWEHAEPIPAIHQVPLFDVEEWGEHSLQWLRDISPSCLLEQLFISMVGQGLASAHGLPEAELEPFRTSLRECAAYLTGACCRDMGIIKQQLVCTVYEVLEKARVASEASAPVESDTGEGVSMDELTLDPVEDQLHQEKAEASLEEELELANLKEVCLPPALDLNSSAPHNEHQGRRDLPPLSSVSCKMGRPSLNHSACAMFQRKPSQALSRNRSVSRAVAMSSSTKLSGWRKANGPSCDVTTPIRSCMSEDLSPTCPPLRNSGSTSSEEDWAFTARLERGIEDWTVL